MKEKPIDPVKPVGMDIILYYPCPFCKNKVPIIAPVQPSLGYCDRCHREFPLVPADEKSINFLKLIFDDGRAIIDSTFI